MILFDRSFSILKYFKNLFQVNSKNIKRNDFRNELYRLRLLESLRVLCDYFSLRSLR